LATRAGVNVQNKKRDLGAVHETATLRCESRRAGPVYWNWQWQRRSVNTIRERSSRRCVPWRVSGRAAARRGKRESGTAQVAAACRREHADALRERAASRPAPILVPTNPLLNPIAIRPNHPTGISPAIGKATPAPCAAVTGCTMPVGAITALTRGVTKRADVHQLPAGLINCEAVVDLFDCWT
jgi:hypothetical protein